MKLEVRDLWSPDLDPPSDGLPPDPLHFCTFVQVAIGAVSEHGHEVFSFTTCSPSELARAKIAPFGGPTLVLDAFDWTRVRDRIGELLATCSGCRDWTQVKRTLAPVLRYDDAV